MPVPTDSKSPTAISPTEQWLVGGIGAVVRGTRQIRDWIIGMSPSTATVHDTGWVTITVTDPSWGPYGGTDAVPAIRRIGRVVYLRGLLRALATIPGSTYVLGTVPTQFWPDAREIMHGTIGPSTRDITSTSTSTSGASSAASTGPASTGTAHTHTMAHTHSIAHTHTVPISGLAVRIDMQADGDLALTLASNDTITVGAYLSLSAMTYVVD
jgi:hypothetical protein